MILTDQQSNLLRFNEFCWNVAYRIYAKYSVGKAWANGVDPDQMLQNAASDLGQHWLPLIQQCLDTPAGSKKKMLKF